jgi:hypothetical protein
MPASAVHVTRAQVQSLPLNTNPATVVGAVGVSVMGPIGKPVLCLSWQDYLNNFGGFSDNAQDFPLQVKALFDEAGDQGNVQLNAGRVVQCTTVGDPTTKTSAAATLALLTAALVATAGADASGNAAPWTLVPGQHVDVAVDGAPDAAATTFTATQAAMTGTNNGPYALVNGYNLVFTIDGVAYPAFAFLTAMFASIGAATAIEVVAAFNAYFAANGVPAVATVASGPKVTVTSNQAGSGSSVNIIDGGSPGASAVLGWLFSSTADGTGNVANIAAVTMAEAIALVGAIAGLTASNDGSGHLLLTSNTTGTASEIRIDGATSATGLGFDSGGSHFGTNGGAATTLTVNGLWDGTYANALSVEVSPPSSGSGTEFNLTLLNSGVVTQAWSNLSLDPSSPRYAPYVVNGPPTVNGLPGANLSGQAPSTLITLTDALLAEDSGVSFSSARPAGSVSPSTGTVFGPLAGGADGLAGLSDTDWSGGVTNNGRTGFRVLDLVNDLAILLAPGRATATTHNAMVNYCESVQGGLCFTILDTPATLTALQITTYVQQTALLSEVSEMAAIYWPRLQFDNPDPTTFGQASTVVTGPSGAIAGLCARLDGSKPGGAFEHPASIEKGSLTSARGLETIGGIAEVQDITKRGLVFDALINPLMIKPGTRVYVDGARTLRDTGPFPTVGESRGVLSVQIALTDLLDPKRNENMRPRFYNEITQAVTAYLKALTRAGCFASNVDAEAWYFQMGPSINTPAVQAARQALALLGLATSKPAEQIFCVIAPFTPASLSS